MKFSLFTFCTIIVLLFNQNSTCYPQTDVPIPSVKISQLKDQPQNDVNVIYKDKNGFMWIGTLDGLHKYDGYTYKTYRVQADDKGISSNLIKSIDEDSLGNIWIGTYDKGLCKLNPLTETFTNFYNTPAKTLFNSNDITTMIVDDENVIWTGNWLGINRITFDPTMSNIVRVDIVESGKNDTYGIIGDVKCLHQDKFSNIWIGTNTQLCRYLDSSPLGKLRFKHFDILAEAICDSDSGIFAGNNSVYHLSNKTDNPTPELITANNASTLLYYDHKLWIGNRNGLYSYQKQKNGVWKPLDHFSTDYSDNGLSCNIVSYLATDINHQIWIGTRGGGVSIASQKQKQFEHYKQTHMPGSLNNNLCRSVFEDHMQNLWIGTEEQGISYLPKGAPYESGFRQIDVNSDPLSNRAYSIEEMMTPRSKHYKSLIWVGTSYPTKLTAFDPRTLLPLPRSPLLDSLGFVFALKATNDSMLWVGTYGQGLFRLKISAEGDVVGLLNMIPGDDNPGSISSYIVRSIFEDSKGNLWIGTDKGLNKLSAAEAVSEKPKFQVFSKRSEKGLLPHDYILQIFESRDGTIWIGTMGGGLLKHTTSRDNRQAIFTKYTTNEGLPNKTIKSINQDKAGFLWLTSNKGLTRFDAKTEEISNYDKSDGLQDNEFSEICSVTRKNGQIVLGGIKGFNVFYPEQIKSDMQKPIMYLTDFYIKNQEIKVGEKNILQKTLQFTDEIKLKFRDNSFSIGFVGLNYNAPQKNNYQYMLQGFDEQWYKASPDYRAAKYTNIPPGKYTFKVIGSNSDNVWSNNPAQLTITIAPPFYRSNYALVFYILIVLGFIWLQRYLWTRKNKRKNELLLAKMERNQMEELSQLKLRFFTNISHEFRTPLTLVAAPLDKLTKNNEESSPGERATLYSLMNQNIKIMMRLINQLMDFRKLEQDKLALKVFHFNLSDFVRTIFSSFTELANQKQLDYRFITEEPDLMIWADPEMIERIVYNLLANAFKYSPNGKMIQVKISSDKQKNSAYITVKDTGIGIKTEAQPHIFERYFRDGNQLQHNVGGTGIGLALSKGMVNMHKGSLTFESEEGKGSTFTAMLPLGKEHFKLEDIEHETMAYQFTSPSTGANTVKETGLGLAAHAKHETTVLIVEDNHDLRLFLAQSLKDEFNVLVAEDGQVAWEKCDEDAPDIIVSDIMMPNMDGIELCRRIKTTEATSHVPVILLTAKNTVESRIEGLETGADSYLDKPFNVDVLKASILSILKNRDQLRRKFQKEIAITPNLIANNSVDSKFIDKILSIIEEHLSDSEFSVETLASTYGVSRIYLNRKIKALTGETTNQFIRNIRLKHAAEMLKNKEMNVSEVTWMVGYNDLKTFRVRFKEMFGVSPSKYQEIISEEED